MTITRRRNAPRAAGQFPVKTAACVLSSALFLAGAPAADAEDRPPQEVADASPGEDAELSAEEAGEDAELSAEEAAALQKVADEGETIVVWGERPDKPFDRDTELRLTGEELAERGATDLAEALELVPELNVRLAGRGGRQIDIRGARKGSIKIIIDGIPVSDPYYGNFDISSIPVTDIEQIRVSAAPSSPIDGTGGPGGVVEVHTRDAVGTGMVRARVRGSSLPAADASATGRAMLTDTLAVRTSASGVLGSRDFTVLMPDETTAELDQGKESGNGALRLEYRDGDRRAVLDGSMQHRSFVVPPGEDDLASILVIDGETSARLGASADDVVGKTRLQARAYAHALERRSTYYADATLAEMERREDLAANRAGATFLANRPLGATLHAIGSAVLETEDADVEGFDGTSVGGRATSAELAAGLQYEDGPLAADLAAGVAVPIGLGADPWPEAKLSGTWRPAEPLAIEATLGRKGRVPSLRERFRLDVGNQALGPEQASYGEIAVDVQPVRGLELEVASFLRRTNGRITYDGETQMLVNTGELDMRGVDVRAEVDPATPIEGGASLHFIEAWSAERGQNPLDHLPSRRADAWLSWAPGGWGLTARAEHIGERLDRSETLPAYTVFDASAFARLPRGLFASLRVDNLADERYALRVGGVRAPGRVFRLLLQGQWD